MEELGALLPRLRAPLPGAVGARLVQQLADSECPALTARRARRAERSGAPHDPIVWAQARGANVMDADGNRYVDLSAGFGVGAVGHGHPEVTRAVSQQTERLLHALGDLHPSDAKVALLCELAALAPFDSARVVLGLSGADAVEAALKTAVLKTGRPGVVAFEGGYHGLSHGPLALCGYSQAFRAPFAEQLNPHVGFAPYPQQPAQLAAALSQVERALQGPDGAGAVVVEPILGRGGVVVPPPGFLPGLRALCDAHGALLVCDEILTGLGRCGAWFRSGDEGVVPDLVCVGKALGGGLPISACIGQAEVMAAWGTPDGEAIHTGTFFGHPLACAAALATLRVMRQEALLQKSQEHGQQLRRTLVESLGDHPAVREVRGVGQLTGIEVRDGALALAACRALLERGFIVVPAGSAGQVLQLTPMLGLPAALGQAFAQALVQVLQELP